MGNSSMSRSMKAIGIILFCSTLILFMPTAKSILLDKISANHTLRDGVGTIESANGVFELGFFSPGSSENRYLGIWFKKIMNKPVVWVANREAPLADASGVLRVNGDGILELMDGTDSIVWSSNSTKSIIISVAQLLDNGNLVIRHENDTDPENFLWESFDHPADSLLSDMKIGWDLKKGFDRYLTSWKSDSDPSPGDYNLEVSLDGYPQILLWKGTNVHFRFGPWDGIQFSGVLFDIPETGSEVKFIFKPEQILYIFKSESNSSPTRMMLTPSGAVRVLKWIDQAQGWKRYLTAPGPGDICAQYALCGGYGSCSITQHQLGDGVCGCLKGYTPKFPEKWKVGDWTNGCVRKSHLECGNGDGFVKYSGLKLPDTRRSWFNLTMDHKGCENVCLMNCSCTAYAYIDIRQGGLGCLLWFDDLLDMRDYNGNGLDLYVKVAAAELVANMSSSTRTPVRIIAISLSVLVAILLGILLKHLCKKKKLRTGTLLINPESIPNSRSKKKDLDLPLFDFITIANATNNFSETNKLGEGGFGPVYKGILDEGQEIAVKRLSKDSRQGLEEFKTEVSCIAKLQHRNLVRLLGCCIEEEEMLLVYEYMSNKSLDSIIFDRQLSKLIHWPQRCNIINGIARGILYLHQDSRLRIIHRDLKASNILLDNKMNPRISDFGMARSFGASGRLTNTTKVVGTFGYMAPEYALDGVFSVKSDVYSFGVLVLEIISGKKMRGFYHSDPSHNLLGHAWRLYKEGKLVELIVKEMLEHCNMSQVFRAIQIGLLCVQPHPEDRPNMALVVLMLSSEIELPEPKQPGFFTERINLESDSSSSNHLHLLELFLSNTFSITDICPR